MISPIWIGPGATLQEISTAINDTFRQLEQDNRSRITKDETGTNRIVLGRFPTGEYGLAVSIPGLDVLTALEQ